MTTFKSSFVEEILAIEDYSSDILRMNATFSDIKTLFRQQLPCASGTFSVMEIAREYLTVMSKMAWRLSVLCFEVGKSQIPELQVFKQNVTVLLNNINKLEVRLREMVLAEKLWTRRYRGTASPRTTDYEFYWTKALKSSLDKIYLQVNNLIHTAIGLGSVYKVRLSILDKQMQMPLYEPKIKPTELQALQYLKKTKEVSKGEIND